MNFDTIFQFALGIRNHLGVVGGIVVHHKPNLSSSSHGFRHRFHSHVMTASGQRHPWCQDHVLQHQLQPAPAAAQIISQCEEAQILWWNLSRKALSNLSNLEISWKSRNWHRWIDVQNQLPKFSRPSTCPTWDRPGLLLGPAGPGQHGP